MKISAEYIWIDGKSPTKTLRSKNQVLQLNKHASNDSEKTFESLSRSLDLKEMCRLFFKQDWWGDLSKNFSIGQLDAYLESLRKLVIPAWGFDGSSTHQADTKPSDRPLIPVCATINPLRSRSVLVLCEVLEADGKTPHTSNTRRRAVELAEKFSDLRPIFGIEQEYTLFEGGLLANVPYGWPERGQAPPQGPYYCGVGLDEVPGHDISVEHEEACRDAGLLIRGTNGEVMPGQWEFQTDAADAITVSDHLWLMRYLLYRIAAKHNATVKLDPKPLSGDWNGAGAHTNFSTAAMRGEILHDDGSIVVETEGFSACQKACEKLKTSFDAHGFPKVYGHGYEKRLTGAHETCSYKEFKYGVADRGASIRIPLHVEKSGVGYIEDRRPCANIDPYEVTAYLMETVCG